MKKHRFLFVGIFGDHQDGLFLTQLVVLAYIGTPDWGVAASTYFGYWLAGAALLAAGMFGSVLTSSTTVAFVLGVVICASRSLSETLPPRTICCEL